MIKKITVNIVFTLFLIPQFSVSEEIELIDMLCQKQVLTHSECQTLEKRIVNKSGETQELISSSGKPKICSKNKEFCTKIGGRIHMDAGIVKDGNRELTPGNGTEVRRARLSVAGRVYSDWRYKLRVDFSGNEVSMKDANLNYQPYKLVFGLSKVLYSMEDKTSSNDTMFMERSLMNELVPGRRVGLGVRRAFQTLHISGNLYGQAIADGEEGDEGIGAAFRVHHVPIKHKTAVLHYSISAAIEQPEDDVNREINLRTRPEYHITDRLLDSGSISDVDYFLRSHAEAAAVYGPYVFQTEYARVDIERRDGSPSLTFSGAYLQLAWMISGESRPYKSSTGVFTRVKPKHESGAWQVALRYSELSLNDADISGGKESNWTLGLNWFANARVRFSANLIQVDTNKDAGDFNPLILAFRGQLVF